MNFLQKDKKNTYEEKDFFLSYLNKHIKAINKQIETLTEREQKEKEKLTGREYFKILNDKIILMENKSTYENIKCHYYEALSFGSHKKSALTETINKKIQNELNINKEKKIHKNSNDNIVNVVNSIVLKGEFYLETKAVVEHMLNLIFVGKFLKNSEKKDEILNVLEKEQIRACHLDEIINFYESIFSLSCNKNKSNERIFSKINFSSNFLEIYCNSNHPMHNHFQEMFQNINKISNMEIFLKKNTDEIAFQKKNFKKKKNYDRRNDEEHKINSSSDFNNSLHKNEKEVSSDSSHNNLQGKNKSFFKFGFITENYDGDSEKSMKKYLLLLNFYYSLFFFLNFLYLILNILIALLLY